MLNYGKSEKSRGAVIFANNTETVDYLSIAQANARLIDRYLGLPTTILTTTDDTKTNRRYDVTNQQVVEWKNFGRSKAFDLSPYDETLLVDSDYLIMDDAFSKVFDVINDYMLPDKNLYATNIDVQETMGEYSLPFVWATAIFFKKTDRSRQLFDFVKMIEKNYSYYRALYNIKDGNYRNDYAFAIAHYVINGYTISQREFLPWPIVTVPGVLDSLVLDDNKLTIRTPDRAYVSPKQSIHILSKHYLQTQDFRDLVEAALA
jgi:hypothetical protein